MFCLEPRLSNFNLGPNREKAAKLTLNKQGEALRWFYFPFEVEEGQDFSKPRTKAPPRIISPKLYCCGPPAELEGMVDGNKAERVSAGTKFAFERDKIYGRGDASDHQVEPPDVL